MGMVLTQQSFFFPSLDSIVNVASVPQRSVFRYPGGKTWLVPQVRRWLAARSSPRLSRGERKAGLFLEPFAGGGIVGLTVAFEGLAERVLLVERDPDVSAVWRVILNGQAESLAQRIREYSLTRDNVRLALAARPRTLMDRAFLTLLRNRVQHGGIMAPGASIMKDGENGKGIGSRWYPETLARRIQEISIRRDRIGFEQADAFAMIDFYKQAQNILFFIDPPYTVAGKRLYRFSQVDHPRLFHLMRTVRGDFLMTYDDTTEVRRWAADCDFDVEKVAMKSRQHTEKYELLIGKNLDWTRG